MTERRRRGRGRGSAQRGQYALDVRRERDTNEESDAGVLAPVDREDGSATSDDDNAKKEDVPDTLSALDLENTSLRSDAVRRRRGVVDSLQGAQLD